ncbi:MAG: SRPBCC domain-containing protein [Burkholderiales bacterium]|nr:SRPBCC domain-containing protein [Burkholderiales bacterium]
MRMEGRFEVGAPRERVWRCITDATLMVACIPGCEEIEPVDARSYRARVLVEVGPIKARFNLVVEVTEELPFDRVASVTRGEEGTRASMLSADNLVTLTELGPELTEVRYSSEVSVTGRLAKYGLGMMRKRVDRLGVQFAERFRERIGSGALSA